MNIVCIVCPSSCRLTVEEKDGDVVVSGYGCKRGLAHGKNEFANPMRMLTSTVKIEGGALSRLPVTTTGEVPKAKLRDCLAAVYCVSLTAPIQCGEVIISNICDTGVDVISSRTMKSTKQ